MANEQNEEGQSSWFRTIVNSVMIYFVINAATSFIGGKFGSQKEASSSEATGGGQVQQSTTNTVSPAVPALWPLGTKMVRSNAVEKLTVGYEDLPWGEHPAVVRRGQSRV